jgi:hypothetical protein
MRISKTVVPTTAAQSVYDLLGLAATDTRGSEEVILQAPAGNAANLNFGSAADQSGFIIPGGSAALEIGSLKNLHVKGNGSDSVIILVLR